MPELPEVGEPTRLPTPKIIEEQVKWWEGRIFATGEPALLNGREMLSRYPFAATFKGNLCFSHPRGKRYQPIIEEFTQLDEKVRSAVGLSPNRGVNILMVPESRFCPRGGGAAPSGDTILVDVSPAQMNLYNTWTHERIHSVFSQSYGICSVPDLTEGAAMYFTQKALPDYALNHYELIASQLNVYEKLAKKRGPIGISHTALLGQLGMGGGGRVAYEYSYVFGAFLAKHIVEKYGRNKYLEFYQETCQTNLFDTVSGRQLIANHQICPGVKNRDIISQALKLVGLDPLLIDRELSQELQELAMAKQKFSRKLERISRAPRGNIFRRIGDYLQRMERIE